MKKIIKGDGLLSEDISNYAPPSDDLLEILGMRLYDIQNQLCSQMMKTGKKKDYIQYKARNGINNKFYTITVCCEEIE